MFCQPMNSTTNRILHLLSNCTSSAHIHQIQAQLIRQNLHCDTTVVDHFITASLSLGLLNSALALFVQIPRPHVFVCNTLIRAFAHSQIPYTPLSVYTHMRRNSTAPNNYTFPFLLKSLSDFRDLRQGQCLHTHVIKFGHLSDIYVQNSLLDVYASCGHMRLCQRVFDEMPQRDVVSWTVLIMGHKNAREYDDALIAFEDMQYAGVVPNHVTMVNALAACANSGALEMGVWIHDFIKRSGWDLDVVLGTALIDMYGKCGRIEEGLDIFGSMKEKNVFTWNVLIKGLAFAKSGKEAVRQFDRMEKEGFKADEVTVLGVLCACSHSRLVDTGHQIFGSLMDGKYGFSPSIKHYASMIDLYARAGFLEDAFKLIRVMPFEPTKSMWGSLLAGSRAQGNLDFSEFAAWKLVELEPENSAYYVVLSNLYAEMGKWNDVEKVRIMMKERGLRKDRGFSYVEPESEEQFHEILSP